MELSLFEKRSEFEWLIPRQGAMRVPVRDTAKRENSILRVDIS